MLTGTGVALVTPFKNGEIDYSGLAWLIDYQINNKVDYIVALGTTGEAATLSKEEKIEVLNFCKSHIAGRVPIVVGVGSNDTAFVQRELKSLDLSGVDAILSVCPYYNKPSQEGIFQHYIALTEVTDVPIVIYNVPGRTGVNILPETTIRLAKYSPQFIGIKEASGDLEQVAKLIRDKPNDFLVVSGNDELVIPYMVLGSVGIISVIANSHPLLFSDIVRSCIDGDYKTANQLNAPLIDVIDLLFAEGNPVGVKSMLNIQFPENVSDSVRLPLVAGSESLRTSLKTKTESIQVTV